MSHTPEGYQTVMPYLIIPVATKFIEFTKAVFNAGEKHKAMRDENTVMHCEVIIGGSAIMFADGIDDYPSPKAAGLFIYVPDAYETFSKAPAAGATVVIPMSDQSYGRSGGVKDSFGNTRWITTDTSKNRKRLSFH